MNEMVAVAVVMLLGVVACCVWRVSEALRVLLMAGANIAFRIAAAVPPPPHVGPGANARSSQEAPATGSKQ